jgi:hypothetical protein
LIIILEILYNSSSSKIINLMFLQNICFLYTL